MNIRLNIDSSIFNENYLKNGYLYDYSHRWNLLYGGA